MADEDSRPTQPSPENPPASRHKLKTKELEKRIEAIHDTVKRARSALLLCILASGAMFLCLWNTYASWDRDFAFLDNEDYVGVRPESKDPNLPDKFVDKEQVKSALKNGWKPSSAQAVEAWKNHIHSLPPNLHEQQMHSWVDTQVVSIALLGIKISVSDFAIVGSLALGLCSLYLLLCVRRENHEVGYLFREMSEEELRACGPHALAMVSSFMVFNLSDRGALDGVICSRKKEPESHTIPLIRGASYFLDFLPVVTVVATIICDLGWTLWKTSYGHMFFLSPFRSLAGERAVQGFSGGEIAYFCFAEIFAVVAAIVMHNMSRRMKAYDKGIRDLLDEISEWLIKEGLIARRWPKQEAVGTGK